MVWSGPTYPPPGGDGYYGMGLWGWVCQIWGPKIVGACTENREKPRFKATTQTLLSPNIKKNARYSHSQGANPFLARPSADCCPAFLPFELCSGLGVIPRQIFEDKIEYHFGIPTTPRSHMVDTGHGIGI